MNLTHLKYFHTVAETGKIASAAEALFISAPALSTALARLEKELGMPLFERSGNRVTLNKQGQIFLRYVEQVFAANASAVADFKAGNQKVMGFLVGQVMKELKGKADPKAVNQAVREKLGG